MDPSLRRIVVGLLFFLSVLGVTGSGAAWHSCGRCMGPQNPATDAEQSGGDDRPLAWRSGQRLEHAADGARKEHRCFERRVRNGSDVAVSNVWWQIAHYFRSVIPPKAEPCETFSFEGGFQSPLRQGPLHFGIGRDPNYQTQVFVPDRGFPGQVGANRYGEAVSSTDGGRPALSSVITFFLPRDGGTYHEVTAELKSEVTATSASVYRYTYSVSHNARQPIQIQWAYVSDGKAPVDLKTDFTLRPDRPVLVRAASHPMVFERTAFQPPKSAVGPVTISDASGNVLARSMASSYGPSSGVIVEPR